MLNALRDRSPLINRTYQYLKRIIYVGRAKGIADNLYIRTFGRKINWSHPTEFNEKIRWIQFNRDITLWIKLADKFEARKYLENLKLGRYLPALYAKWDSPKSIDFSNLPDKFVIKPNNGCGDVIVFSKSIESSEHKAVSLLRKNFYNIYGLESGEIQYSYIKPCIFAEEFIDNDSDFSSSLVDYKFFCFMGEPKICGVYYDRKCNSHDMNSTFYDMDWQIQKQWRDPKIMLQSKDIPKPKCFDEMKSLCRTLAKEFHFVRIDLYESNGKVYFGEFTFTPASCCGGSLNPAFFIEFGSWIKLQN
ncbi:MAG: hypothetical protein NC453_14685 [Muribaculum sp.]|nr:hypothetical protein [Muribaculum sp.]